MDIIVSRQFLALVTSSSSCFTRVSKSKEEGPGTGWLGGGPRD